MNSALADLCLECDNTRAIHLFYCKITELYDSLYALESAYALVHMR